MLGDKFQQGKFDSWIILKIDCIEIVYLGGHGRECECPGYWCSVKKLTEQGVHARLRESQWWRVVQMIELNWAVHDQWHGYQLWVMCAHRVGTNSVRGDYLDFWWNPWSTMSAPILFADLLASAYLVCILSVVVHPGGVATVCNPSGGRIVWTWGSELGPAEACGGPAHSKFRVSSASSSEDEEELVLEREASREAGNRAALTPRSE